MEKINETMLIVYVLKSSFKSSHGPPFFMVSFEES